MSGNPKNTGQKRTFSNSAEEYRGYLIRVMRTRVSNVSLRAEVWQSRKQINGGVRHGSCVASAASEGSIAIERVHQYLDRF
jgi:hypothetical protein